MKDAAGAPPGACFDDQDGTGCEEEREHLVALTRLKGTVT
jgi:hypothetical protein